jgi:hypothetical protein
VIYKCKIKRHWGIQSLHNANAIKFCGQLVRKYLSSNWRRHHSE